VKGKRQESKGNPGICGLNDVLAIIGLYAGAPQNMENPALLPRSQSATEARISALISSMSVNEVKIWFGALMISSRPRSWTILVR